MQSLRVYIATSLLSLLLVGGVMGPVLHEISHSVSLPAPATADEPAFDLHRLPVSSSPVCLLCTGVFAFVDIPDVIPVMAPPGIDLYSFHLVEATPFVDIALSQSRAPPQFV